MTTEEKSMSGKLVTGNDGNFMLLLDPLSEDKAVFTSIRCDPASEVTSSNESIDSTKTIDLTEPDVLTSSCENTARNLHDTLLPDVQSSAVNSASSLQPVLGSTKTSLVSSGFASTVTMASSTTTFSTGVTSQSTGPFAFAVLSGNTSNSVQYVNSKLTPNTSIANNEGKFYFPPVTPMLIIPSSSSGQSLPSSILSTSVMQSNPSTNRFPAPCTLTASSVLQSIVQAEHGIRPSSNTQVTNTHSTPKQPDILETNNSKDRLIQVVYPASLNASLNASKWVTSNSVILPMSKGQTTMATTKAAPVPTTIFSHNAAAAMIPSKVFSTVSSQPLVFPVNSTQSVSMLPAPVMSSSIPSTTFGKHHSGVQTSLIEPPSVPIIKQMTSIKSGFEKVLPAPDSLLKNKPCTSVPVTSYVASSNSRSIVLSSNSQNSNMEPLVLNPGQPVILTLPSGGRVPLPPEAIKSIEKSKSKIARIVITSSSKVNASKSANEKAQGKETVKAVGSSTDNTQQKNKTGNFQLGTACSQAVGFPQKIYNNILSLANQGDKSTDVNTKLRDKITKTGQLIITDKVKSGLAHTTRLTNSLDPCYIVLEKLSDRQIAHVMSSIAEQKRDKCRRRLRSRNRSSDSSTYLERKCSSYCRQRTLNFLCKLGMIKCRRKVKQNAQTRHIVENNSNTEKHDVVQTSQIQLNTEKQDAVKTSQSGSTFLREKSHLTSNTLNLSSVQAKSSTASSLQKSAIEIAKIVSTADAAKGTPSKVIVNSKKGMPMQLVVVNSKLYLLPISNNISVPLIPSVFSTSVLNNGQTTLPDVRSRLAAGVHRPDIRGPAPGNQFIIRNICPPLPTFCLSATTNVPPMFTSSNPSGSAMQSLLTSATTQTTRVSNTPIIIRAPFVRKETTTVPLDTMKSVPANKDDMTPKDTMATGKKIEPWKLPWNYEIKSEPVTEGYGDEDESRKTGQVNQNTNVMTIRLPLPSNTVSTALTRISGMNVGGSVTNNASSQSSSAQPVSQSFIPSKFVKTNKDLLVASSQSDRIRRLKEILREKEIMLEELKRKQVSLHQ